MQRHGKATKAIQLEKLAAGMEPLPDVDFDNMLRRRALRLITGVGYGIRVFVFTYHKGVSGSCFLAVLGVSCESDGSWLCRISESPILDPA